jgi:N-acetylglucosamine kinase-like BadF-type ATPase
MNLLAVDVGGTSTRAVILRDDGTCIGYGSAGSGNPTSSGATQSAASIVAATTAAIEEAGFAASEVNEGVIAIAGAAGESGAWLHAEVVRASLPERLTLEPDLLAAFCSGSLAAEGYTLVAGTGSGAVRIRSGQIEATCDCLGWLLGDTGSGFWIGHRAVLAAVSVLDGRGPSTVLADLVLQRLGVQRSHERGPGGRLVALRDTVESVYKLRPVELARFAPLVFEARAAGDDVAGRIIAEAADVLTATLSAVVVADIGGPLVLGGSILSQPDVADRVVSAFRTTHGDSEVVTVSDGVAGSAVLALRRGGVAVDDAVFDRIHTSLAGLRAITA